MAYQDYDATGSPTARKYKIVVYPFEQYELKLKLTPNNEFIEVLEIKLNKDFLSHKQKMSSLNYFNVEEYI